MGDDKVRQPKGTPAGGEFANHHRPAFDGGLAINSPALNTADNIAALARKIELRIVASEFGRMTLAQFPDAIGLQFARTGPFNDLWELRYVRGADGPLTHAEGVFYDEDPKMWELDRQIKPLMERLGRGDDFIASGALDNYLVLNISEQVGHAETSERMTPYRELQELLQAEEKALAKIGAIALVRMQLPSAYTIVCGENTSDNGTLLYVRQIENDNDELLWDEGDEASSVKFDSKLDSFIGSLTVEDLDGDYSFCSND